jgi:hypothetical protein
MDVEAATGIAGAGVTTIDGDGRFALLASPDPWRSLGIGIPTRTAPHRVRFRHDVDGHCEQKRASCERHPIRQRGRHWLRRY